MARVKNNMRHWWGNSAHPPSGAIPRFPIWEVTVILFTGVYGLAGISNLRVLSPDSNELPPAALNGVPPGLVTSAIGSQWAMVWYGALLVACALGVWGLLKPAPDGIIMTLAAMIILCVASGSVSIGLVVERGDLFFPGITLLYVFFIGSFGRLVQCILQLRSLERRVTRIVENGGGV